MLCSFFYPCNSMLHSFMHADAQAAHLMLHPAPRSPLPLPGPHKHPWEGSELQEMTASSRLLLPKRSISFHSPKSSLQKEPLANHSCLLSFQKHPKFICVCSVCVCRPTQPFAARCNIALCQLPPTTEHKPVLIWRHHALLAHRLCDAAKQQLPLTSWKGKIWDQKPNLHFPEYTTVPKPHS